MNCSLISLSRTLCKLWKKWGRKMKTVVANARTIKETLWIRVIKFNDGIIDPKRVFSPPSPKFLVKLHISLRLLLYPIPACLLACLRFLRGEMVPYMVKFALVSLCNISMTLTLLQCDATLITSSIIWRP